MSWASTRFDSVSQCQCLAATITACNGNGTSVSNADSAVSNAADSAKASIDTAAAKVDSTIRAAADTTKAKINDLADSAKKAIK